MQLKEDATELTASLRCKCGNNLAIYHVETYLRSSERSQDGVFVSANGEGHVYANRSMEGNPSPERDGVRIILVCQDDHHTTIEIIEDDGRLLVNSKTTHSNGEPFD